MLNAETKRHIDAARDVLVGVAPNPMTQIDQITYALIYKFMDDMDQAAIKAGGEPSFFVGELEPYSWSKLVDARMGNQEKMNLYGEALQKFSEAKQLPELFRTIFRAAFLPYRSPETLGLFLKEINYFDYTHPEELGNAYEYLLSIMSAQGDAGQFRTPRHIIDFMVDVMNPTKDDKVLDPACGTGGFLVASYNHILEQHDGKDDPNKKERALTPDERKKLMANFEGYDIDPSMVRIAQVNMYLHQFKNPKIFQYDSLTSEERWNDKFDVILANPPFMSPKGGIKPHNKFAIQSNRSEVLFVDYIANHLKPNGRAAIIVPEGIIFQSGKAYKQLRKELVEGGLYAVVSLPSGVFNPYSGVKTSILLINNEIAKQKDEILFVKITNDGYDLGATKRPIEKNDLPIAIEIINEWAHSNEIDKTIASAVGKVEIQANSDFSLNYERYISADKLTSEWPLVKLSEIATYINGFAFKPDDWGDSGIPIIRIQNLTGSSNSINYTLRSDVPEKYIVNYGDLLISWSATIGFYFWKGPTAYLNQHIFKVVPTEKVLSSYLFHMGGKISEVIRSKVHGNTMQHITRGLFEEIEIPLPPIEVQEQIVAELDGYAAIIEGAKKIVENWKPRIDVDPEWPFYELGELVEILDSKRKPITKSDRKSGHIPYYGATGIVDYVADYIFDEPLVLVGEDGAKWASGERTAFLIEGKTWVNNHAHVLRPNRKRILDVFLADFLTQSDLSPFITGVTVPKLNQEKLRSIAIPLPEMEVQKKIVERLLIERAGVQASANLMESMSQRLNETVQRLWSA
jgi:type I restriction enzyme M protein